MKPKEVAAIDARLRDAWALFEQRFDRYVENLQCYNIIRNIISNGFVGFSNILLYSAGFPSHLIISHMIRAIFNESTHNGCAKIFDKDVMYHEYPYHFEVDCMNPMQTKSIEKFAGFIKHIASHKCIHSDRHVMVMLNVDAVVRDSAQSFRVLLERFSNNVIFICTTNVLSAIEKPIVSRFMCIRVPLFTTEQIQHILEDIGFEPSECAAVANFTDHRNLPYCMYVAAMSRYQQTQCNLRYPFLLDYWGSDCSKPTLDQLRSLTQKIHNLDIAIPNLANDLIKISKDRYKANVISLCTAVDHWIALTDGNRKSLYIEYLVNSLNSLGAFN
jgi:hypothetical protein